jgi:protein-S-isoprenylcysteine O-methyltransferase Ste14
VERQRLINVCLKIAGLALVVPYFAWLSGARWSSSWQLALIWVAPLLALPVTLLGRWALDLRPVAERAQRADIVVHYLVGGALGTGIISALLRSRSQPGILIPVWRPVGLGLVVVASLFVLLTVLTLALRGFGAPFAAKLSSRLVTDWMYRYTRNPMVLATIVWLFCLGLCSRSLWFVIWVFVIFSPSLLFFVRHYEERELEIRFGPTYLNYKSHTPMLFPHRHHHP